ncbi:MAG: 5-formyltetrahydrofolate cyclo-ligase [Alphaproteobacteria bacterium]|nr:5-formyltetrahydrofolate cyclo-ligase [Alphaproteobacteria bacterium]
MPSDAAVIEAKRALRAASRTAQRAAHAAAGREAGERLRENFRNAVAAPAGVPVSGYWPMEGEMDPRVLMADMAAQGHPLCLPVVQGRGKPLLFRAWRKGDAMVPGSLGIPAPDPAAAAVTPALLLVPLLAFDREGFRLGHGAGYYDMTLAGLRAAGPVLAVGVAYAGQEVARVPREAHDQPLDWVVTEGEAIRIGAKA